MKTIVTNGNQGYEEGKDRLNSGIPCYHFGVDDILSSYLRFKNVKIKIY